MRKVPETASIEGQAPSTIVIGGYVCASKNDWNQGAPPASPAASLDLGEKAEGTARLAVGKSVYCATGAPKPKLRLVATPPTMSISVVVVTSSVPSALVADAVMVTPT